MEQTKALNALEPFLLLSKSATSPRAAADLITRATSAPQTFIFAELLSTPNILALSTSPEYLPHLTLLRIFSYGTYTTYLSTPHLPPLNAAQTLKLRQLTLLSLAKNPRDLTYANLQRQLGLSSERELEDLVISAIYAGLVAGTLDPYHKSMLISSVSPLRDLPPNSIPGMLSTLSAWSDRCSGTLRDLESQIRGIRAQAVKRAGEEAEWNAQVEKLLEGKEGGKGGDTEGGRWGLGKRTSTSKRGNAFEGAEFDEGMDVDEDDEDGGEKRGKKRGFGTLSFGK